MGQQGERVSVIYVALSSSTITGKIASQLERCGYGRLISIYLDTPVQAAYLGEKINK